MRGIRKLAERLAAICGVYPDDDDKPGERIVSCLEREMREELATAWERGFDAGERHRHRRMG